MPTSFTENYHAAAFILWEEAMNYSRDNVVIKSGSGILIPGTVVGRITQTDTVGSTAAKAGGNVGGMTFVKDVSAPIQTGASIGVWTVTMTDATHFNVNQPNGALDGTGVAGTTYNQSIKFMLAASGATGVAGDGFVFPVTGASGGNDVIPNVAGASDGSQTSIGLIIYRVDATSVDVPVAMISRNAQINGRIVQVTALQATDLAKVGIIVRY